jgi:transposase-like protein
MLTFSLLPFPNRVSLYPSWGGEVMAVKNIKKYINKRPGDGPQTQWSPQQKVDAVAKYLLLGNIMEVVRQTGIPEITLRKWKAEDWWKETEDELRKQSNQQLEGKLGNLIDKSIAVTLESLEQGDLVYNQKTGKFVRVPLKARVSHQIAKDMIDRKFLLEKIATKEKFTEEAISDRLIALKQEFLKFVNSKEIKNEPVEQTQKELTIIDVQGTQSSSN